MKTIHKYVDGIETLSMVIHSTNAPRAIKVNQEHTIEGIELLVNVEGNGQRSMSKYTRLEKNHPIPMTYTFLKHSHVKIFTNTLGV